MTGNQAGTTSQLEANLDLFRSLVAAIDDVNTVWNGLQRLEVVSITLSRDAMNRNWYSSR